MIRDTLWLVGMMGAGKSTVGPLLAQRLGRRFIDLDAEIERAEGRSISQIFAADGEAYFRRVERARIEALAHTPAVVALGGGAIAQPGAPDRLGAAGTVVYLRGSPETLLGRLGDCRSRPMLRGATGAERLSQLKSLLANRSSAYETASIVIDVDAGDASEIADCLHEMLLRNEDETR